MLNLTEKIACGCVAESFFGFFIECVGGILLVDLHKNHVIVTSAVLRLSR